MRRERWTVTARSLRLNSVRIDCDASKTVRDSRLPEQVIWRGKPEQLRTPRTLAIAAVMSLALSLVSLAFAIVMSSTLEMSPTRALVFCGASAILAAVLWQGPKIWLSKVEYLVTENHVVYKRGFLRRTMSRQSISYGRIRWSRKLGIGDLELVRAVPTGALRRRLRLCLSGIQAPERVLAIINRREDVTPAMRYGQPLTARLEVGERVLWSARPRFSFRVFIPKGQEQLSAALLSALLLAVLAQVLFRTIPILQGLVLTPSTVPTASLVALFFGVILTAIVMLLTAFGLVYRTILEPGLLVKQTRYWVTDRRVLIARGREELHLDRKRIVEIIDAPAHAGVRDVFLVLDGPQARALAAGGAFGEDAETAGLKPVLYLVEDADEVRRVLKAESPQDLPTAA